MYVKLAYMWVIECLAVRLVFYLRWQWRSPQVACIYIHPNLCQQG